MKTGLFLQKHMDMSFVNFHTFDYQCVTKQKLHLSSWTGPQPQRKDLISVIQDVLVFLVTATNMFFTPQTQPAVQGDGGRKKGGEKKRSQKNKTVNLFITSLFLLVTNVITWPVMNKEPRVCNTSASQRAQL